MFFLRLLLGSIVINRINAVNHGWKIHSIDKSIDEENYLSNESKLRLRGIRPTRRSTILN